MSRDLDFLVDQFETDVDFLASSWIMLGRPVILFPVSKTMLGDCRPPARPPARLPALVSAACIAVCLTRFLFLLPLMSAVT